MDSQGKISILLAEYNTLRSEVASRTNHLFTLFGAAPTLIIFVLSQSLDSLKVSATIFVVAVFAGVIFIIIDRSIRACGRRLSEIETEINNLAGATLLRWESESALGKNGFIHAMRKAHSKSSLVSVNSDTPPSPVENT